MALFTSRIYNSEDDLPEIARSAVHLFFSNNEVEQHNNRRMELLSNVIPPPRKILCKSIDRITGIKGLPERVREQTLQYLENVRNFKISETQGLPSVLLLQIGIRYMVTVNINVEDGIFNGASGILKDFTTLNEECNIAWVKFDDEKIGI